jgi:hypothetical protein
LTGNDKNNGVDWWTCRRRFQAHRQTIVSGSSTLPARRTFAASNNDAAKNLRALHISAAHFGGRLRVGRR